MSVQVAEQFIIKILKSLRCLVTHQERVLLCKRAIEPRYGLWTVPAGFMENGETLGRACRRDLEEAGEHRSNTLPFMVFSLSQISQVYVLFRSELSAPLIMARELRA